MLNLATATAAEIVRLLPFAVTVESSTDTVAAFCNNSDRTAYDLEVLTGYPVAEWLSLLNEGSFASPQRMLSRGKWSVNVATPPTLPTSSAGKGSLTGPVNSGEYLAPQSCSGHGVRGSSESAPEGSIHDDMIVKILSVLPRGNIFQPSLVPGDRTETLSIQELKGKIHPLLAHWSITR